MNSGLFFQTNKVLLFGEVLILKPKKKKKSFCLELLLWYHTKVRTDFVLVAMQAVSGGRKDCDSLFLLNEVPCVNVVYMGRYFVHGIFPEYFSLFTHNMLYSRHGSIFI